MIILLVEGRRSHQGLQLISVRDTGVAGACGDQSWFRYELHRWLTRRADALFDLSDAVLCAEGPVCRGVIAGREASARTWQRVCRVGAWSDGIQRLRTALSAVVRLAPGVDAPSVTAQQLRGVVDRLIAARHWQPAERVLNLASTTRASGRM
ncbi:hypothetical protein [Actinophytocola sp.]|uniref:hypothetical protein n=1 Tax=Actinophytocola sp. TaxID=1872138 RepID=UPI003D6A742A